MTAVAGEEEIMSSEVEIQEVDNGNGKVAVGGMDYYWRDYFDAIPHDAIPGGHDTGNNVTYIGQGFYKVGILTGTIYPGRKGIKLPYRGQALAEVGIKILCSPNPNVFSWEDAESSTLNLIMLNKHVVVGGCEDGEVIHVGRVMYQGELVVGKVFGHHTGNAKLYFVHRGKEFSIEVFQVLVYDFPKY